MSIRVEEEASSDRQLVGNDSWRATARLRSPIPSIESAACGYEP
jgi:hypothetical protein